MDNCVLEICGPGNLCTGNMCPRKIMYSGIFNLNILYWKRKSMYWKNVYKEICVLENYVQGKICTAGFSGGKLCTGKMCTRKYVYWKIMYNENYVQSNFQQESCVLEKFVQGN